MAVVSILLGSRVFGSPTSGLPYFLLVLQGIQNVFIKVLVMISIFNLSTVILYETRFETQKQNYIPLDVDRSIKINRSPKTKQALETVIPFSP